jgi:hypothetical protein
MSHPLVFALFGSRDAAMAAGRAVQALGVPSRAISVVARTHQEEGVVANNIGGATPGVEIEDSRTAALIGEFSGVAIAAAALVMPGIGPVVTAGPLSAELGEIAGHIAGSLAEILESTGVPSPKAEFWQARVQSGSILLGIHVVEDAASRVAETLRLAGADDVEIGKWAGELP